MAPSGPIVTLTPNPALDLSTSTEVVDANRKLRCGPPRLDPGGGGINVSRVVRRLGGETCAVFVAGGPTGERLVRALGWEGIETACCPVEEDTRESVTVFESSTGDLYRFVLPGHPLSRAEADRLLDRFAERLGPGIVAVGSGSLPGGAPDDFWSRAARRAREAEAVFVIDSSSGVDAALEVGVAVLRLNRHEVKELAGASVEWPDGVAEWCASLVERGAAETVVVTHGSDGALLVDRERLVRASPPEVPSRSAVGAGDSFVAGFTQGLVSGLSTEETLRLAVVAAAAALMTEGTELARREDIDRLLDEAPAATTRQRVPG